MLVVGKPSGLLSVPGRGEHKSDCLLSRVQAVYPGALTVHRLDLGTSGLVVFALDDAAQSQLSRSFRDRQVDKRYLAVVAGHLQPEQGEIDLPLITDWPNRPLQKVDHAIGKPSLTRYVQTGYDAASDTSRVELEPVTGRSHQLRVHLQALGHPIVGDELYAPPRVRQMATRLLLHAWRIELPHPVTGQRLSCEAPAPF
jgi:tRNA pseudouridine32 synthase/23S rRNA pseudouridine746 synthase